MRFGSSNKLSSLLILAAIASLSVANSPAALAKINVPGQMLTAKDDHTAAALKRAAQNEALKKITAKAPTATPSPEETHGAFSNGTLEMDSAEESPSAITKPTVKTEPAPGTAAKSAPAETHESAPSKAASHEEPSHASSTGVSPDQSLRWLTNGNTRYVKKALRADGRSAEDRKRLLGGQKPHAIVLSCADSRVPPEMVFDQVPGEIFVIRVAGEAVDSSVIASVEYAVEHLGPHLLVVMGHTQCGAVTAALDLKDGESAGSEALDKLVNDIRPRLKTVMTEKRSANLEVESTLNADGVARDLVKRSDVIRKKVEAGELVIKPALYRMDSGKVTFY